MSDMHEHAQVHERDVSDSPLRERAGSESPLSDVNDLPNGAAPRADDKDNADASEDDAIHDMATSELEEDEDDGDEKDADFDEETPPPKTANGMRHDRSSSEDDVRSGKRKSAVDDDEFMKQNPELYGLRRSVCHSQPASRIHVADSMLQGRARPQRQVVRAQQTPSTPSLSDFPLQLNTSDEEEDSDDVNTGRRRKRQKTSGARPGMPPFHPSL